MNNPGDVQIDIEHHRAWLKEYKGITAMGWAQLGAAIGVNGSTLSVFATGKYAGRTDMIAEAIYRYRQTLDQQQKINVEAPDIPTYFDTRTSQDIMQLLGWAQAKGRLTYCAGGPGIGKTTTAREYKARASNVWIVTCKKSITTVGAMLSATLRAMRDYSTRGSALQMSVYVEGRLRNSGGLLIYDDAQHLSIDQIEEIRGLHDETNIGVALIGNETVASRMEGGDRRAAFAQLFSRIGHRIERRPAALRADVEALADAWQIHDEEMLAVLHDVARRPGALRTTTFMLELAVLAARGAGEELSVKHLNQARYHLGSRGTAEA